MKKLLDTYLAAHDMTRYELSKESGISAQNLLRLNENELERYTVRYIDAIAHAVGDSPEEVYAELHRLDAGNLSKPDFKRITKTVESKGAYVTDIAIEIPYDALNEAVGGDYTQKLAHAIAQAIGDEPVSDLVLTMANLYFAKGRPGTLDLAVESLLLDEDREDDEGNHSIKIDSESILIEDIYGNPVVKIHYIEA